MAQVLVRGVEPAVSDRFKQRAKESGRAREAEMRLIPEETARHTTGTGWTAAQRVCDRQGVVRSMSYWTLLVLVSLLGMNFAGREG